MFPRALILSTVVTGLIALAALSNRVDTAPTDDHRHAKTFTIDSERELDADPEAPEFESVTLHGYRAGRELRYTIDQSRVVRVRGSLQLDPNEEPIEHEFEFGSETQGALVIRVLEVAATEALLEFVLEPTSISARNGEQTSGMERADFAEQLREPLLATIDATGRVDAMVFSTPIGAEAENYWRDLLARWQLVRSDEADDAWETEETDTTGRCLVAYAQSGNTITKARLAYTKFHPAQGGKLQPNGEITEELEFTIDSIPHAIRGEGVSSLALGPDYTADSRATLELVLASDSELVDAALAARDGRRRFDEGTSTTIARVRADRAVATAPDRGSLDAETIRDHLDTLRAQIHEAGVRNPATVGMMKQLADMIRAEDLAVDLAAALLDGPLPKGMAAVLLGAMASAGTPAAQQAIESVIADPNQRDGLRLNALAVFAEIDEPESSIDPILVALIDERSKFSSTALLVLGAVGDKLSHQSERGRAIERIILDRASDTALTAPERLTALRAIANLRPLETPAVIESAYASHDERVRRAAIAAIERTPDRPATDLLLRAAHDDASEELRREAIRLLATPGRTGGTEALVELALDEESPLAIRHAAAHYLGTRANDDVAFEALTWIEESDESEAVRSVARAAIDAARSH